MQVYEKVFSETELPVEHADLLVEIKKHLLADTKQEFEDKYREDVPRFLSLLSALDKQQAQKYHTHDRRRVVNAIFKLFRDRVAVALNLEQSKK